MIHSQEIALRCAAALPHRFCWLRELILGITLNRHQQAIALQLMDCADDEARRLILGVSH